MGRFTYIYKTSDGVRHTGELAAKTREDVFSQLRAQGIRPIKVIAGDGSKANGEVHGIRRRFVIVTAFISLLVGGGFVYLISNHDPIPDQSSVLSNLEFDPSEKRIAKAVSRRYLDIPDDANVSSIQFAKKGESFLLRFIQPGVVIRDKYDKDLACDDVRDCLDTLIYIEESDPQWARDAKRIVTALKEDVKTLVKAGKRIGEIIEFYETRQKMESRFRESLANEVKRGSREKIEVNKTLRIMGLKPL